MTEYKNRAERRSVQRVELRKIRTEFKQQMKALRINYFDYNAKKSRKTLYYHHLKQTSQKSTAVDITATGTYQEEGLSPQTDTRTGFYTPITEISQEDGHVDVVYNHTDQEVESTAVLKEECIQADKLVLL